MPASISSSTPPNQSLPPPLPDLPNSCEPGGAGVERGWCNGGVSRPAETGGDRCESGQQCGGSGNSSGGTKKKKPARVPQPQPAPEEEEEVDDGDEMPPAPVWLEPPPPEKPPPPPPPVGPPPVKDPTAPPSPPPVKPPPPPVKKIPPERSKKPGANRDWGFRGAKFPPFILKGWFNPNAVSNYTQVPNTQQLLAGAEFIFVPSAFSLRLPLGNISLRMNVGAGAFYARARVYGPEDPSPMKPQEFDPANLFGAGLYAALGLTAGRRTKLVLLGSVSPLAVAGSDPIPTHFAFNSCLKGGIETRSLTQFLISFCYYHTSNAPLLDPAVLLGGEMVTPR